MPHKLDADAFIEELKAKGIAFEVRYAQPSTIQSQGQPEAPRAEPKPSPEPEEPKAKLLPFCCNGVDTWVFPIRTVSEANQRDWRAKSNRTKQAREAVCLGLARTCHVIYPIISHVQSKGRIRVTYTRLGGQGLDPLVNLPSALKGVEDAICLYLGIQDRGDAYEASCDQEPGPRYGVRVTIQIIEPK